MDAKLTAQATPGPALVSVTIPFLNPGRFLDEVIQSVLAQAYAIRGLPTSRHLAIRQPRGDYISLLDADQVRLLRSCSNATRWDKPRRRPSDRLIRREREVPRTGLAAPRSGPGRG